QSQVIAQVAVQNHPKAAEQPLKDHAEKSRHPKPAKTQSSLTLRVCVSRTPTRSVSEAPVVSPQSDCQHDHATAHDVAGQSMAMLDQETGPRLFARNSQQVPRVRWPNGSRHADTKRCDKPAQQQE